MFSFQRVRNCGRCVVDPAFLFLSPWRFPSWLLRLLILLYLPCHLNWRTIQSLSPVCLTPLCELSFDHICFLRFGFFSTLCSLKFCLFLKPSCHHRTLFSSLMEEKLLPSSGHTFNRRSCPREKSGRCEATNYPITDFT